MTRNAKTTHQAVLADAGRRAHQYSEVQFASPKLIAAARADRGHAYMNRAEYIATRMGRGAMHECRLVTAIEQRANRLSSQRVYGNGRRQTGQATRYMRNLTTAGYAERCTTRR